MGVADCQHQVRDEETAVDELVCTDDELEGEVVEVGEVLVQFLL